MPRLACPAKSISPMRCRVSRWPSPRTREAASPEGAASFQGARVTRSRYRDRPAPSLLLGLPADGFLRRRDGLLVAEESAAERLQLLIQFVEHRDAGRNIELHDVALGHHVEHLDQGAQRVSMRDDEHVLVGSKLGDYARFPIGQDAR